MGPLPGWSTPPSLWCMSSFLQSSMRKVALPPSCCRCNFHAFFMTPLTAGVIIPAPGEERGVSVLMLNSFGFNPLGTSPFGPSPLLWASLCFLSPFVLQRWRKEELPFLCLLPSCLCLLPQLSPSTAIPKMFLSVCQDVYGSMSACHLHQDRVPPSVLDRVFSTIEVSRVFGFSVVSLRVGD